MPFFRAPMTIAIARSGNHALRKRARGVWIAGSPRMRRRHLACASTLIALELGFSSPSLAQAPAQPAFDAHRPAYVGISLGAYGVAGALDMISTGRGLSSGMREANPLLHPFEKNPVVLGTVNAAFHGTTTFILWKMARHHPKRAAILSAVLTSVELTVAKHNFDLARRSR